MKSERDTLRDTALALTSIAVKTQNYVTDVLHYVKASGVSVIIAAHEAGSPPDITAIIEQYKIPIGEIAYDDDYADEIRRGFLGEVDAIVDAEISPERYAEVLVRLLVLWEVEHTSLYDDTFERRFPEEFRETAFYKEVRDTLHEKLRRIFRDVEAYRVGASAWARYYSFDVAEKYSMIVWMLMRHDYKADEVVPLFRNHSESVREFCEFVEDNDFEEEPI